MDVYEPRGIEFYDDTTGKQMILVTDDEPQASWHGWLCFRHPDGQWVTVRKATPKEIAMIKGNQLTESERWKFT